MKDILFKMFDSIVSGLSDEAKNALRVNIAIVGATGVGKTSTCNSLLGTEWEVGHSKATTRDLQTKQLILIEKSESIETNIYLTDFPGLGESLEKDDVYIPIYKNELGKFDAIIWILSANERQLASVQSYFNDLVAVIPDFAEKLVVGLNKSDLVEPMKWGRDKKNFPSSDQLQNIESRVQDVFEKFQESQSSCHLIKDQIVAYTAKHDWRIWKLFEVLNDRIKGGKKMSLVRFARPQKWKPKQDVNKN